MIEGRNIVLSDRDFVLCVFQPEARRIFDSGENWIRLSPTEVYLMEMLVDDPGRNISALKLVSKWWMSKGEFQRGALRNLHVHISRLRDKLDQVGIKQLVFCSQGNYRWDGDNYIIPRSNQP